MWSLTEIRCPSNCVNKHFFAFNRKPLFLITAVGHEETWDRCWILQSRFELCRVHIQPGICRKPKTTPHSCCVSFTQGVATEVLLHFREIIAVQGREIAVKKKGMWYKLFCAELKLGLSLPLHGLLQLPLASSHNQVPEWCIFYIPWVAKPHHWSNADLLNVLQIVC